MAEFLGDIAFMLELVIVVAGIVTLYFAQKNASKLLRAAGWLLIIGGILGSTCTGYFYMKYYFNGDFDSAYMQPKHMAPGQMMRHDPAMMKKMRHDPSMMKRMHGGPN